jgi:putative endonuclease
MTKNKKKPSISIKKDNWYLYMILSDRNTIYTGITLNPLKRLELHINKKGAKYFYSNTPIHLKIIFFGLSKSDALSYELKIKKFSANKKRKIFYLSSSSSNEQEFLSPLHNFQQD